MALVAAVRKALDSFVHFFVPDVTRRLGILASSHQGLPITNELASIPLNDRDLKNTMADPRY
jgi:hypothetical protein